MASITFRLRSSSHVGAVNLEGKVISVRDLQASIAERLKAPQEEIKIFIADSTDELHPNEELLAYSVVDVVRQSHTGRLTYANSRAPGRPDVLTGPSSSYASGEASTLPRGAGAVNMASLTEEERLAQLQAEVTLDTGIDQASGMRSRRGGGPGGRGIGGRGRGGGMGARDGGDSMGSFNPMDSENFRPPPKGYVCHNCGMSGHYIQHCPAVKAAGGKHMRLLSLPVGIPESMLVECTMDDPAPKFITRDHRLVKRKMDTAAFAAVVLPTIAGAESPQPPPAEEAPDTVSAEQVHGTDEKSDERAGGAERGDRAADATHGAPKKYLCIIDSVPAKEALKTPCCSKLICKGCFDALVAKAMKSMEDLDADPPECPSCGEPLMMDEFEPATAERAAIEALLCSRKRARSP